MKTVAIALALFAVFACAAAVPVVSQPTTHELGVSGLKGACKSKNFTDANVDWSKYVGVWYELYHSQSFYFDHDCYCTTAQYTANSDGTIAVDNECNKDSITGKRTGAKGKAVPSKTQPGHLDVSFGVSFITAPYDVVYVSDDYSIVAVVSCDGVPVFGGSNVWILARTPSPSQSVVDAVKTRLFDMGFDLSDLVKTVQDGCWN